MKVYSVYQINGYVKGLLEDDLLLSGICVTGEISNYKEHSSGHVYFSLKDPYAAINAVMFRDSAASLAFRPQNGMKVILCGRVSLYDKTGQYQFYAETMEPAGTGGLHLAFEQLKARLEAEGLFDAGRKRSIPAYPVTIGVVTSQSGAALRDIINVAGWRNRTVKLLIAPASVQGPGAAGEIAGAIAALNTHGGPEVIIVGRGGGSMEDLWAFNEEAVARAVYASGIPVVSAVGHETDFTICDFVADLRAPTPSAAAELCVQSAPELIQGINRAKARIDMSMALLIGYSEERLERCVDRMPTPERLTEGKRQRIRAAAQSIDREMRRLLDALETRAAGDIQALRAVAPLNVLKRGYGIMYIDGKPVKSAAEAVGAEGKAFAARFADGSVSGRVEGVSVKAERVSVEVDEAARPV